MSTDITVVFGDDSLVEEAKRAQLENRRLQIERERQALLLSKTGGGIPGRSGAEDRGKRRLRPSAFGGGVTAGLIGFKSGDPLAIQRQNVLEQFIISGNNTAQLRDEAWAEAQANPYPGATMTTLGNYEYIPGGPNGGYPNKSYAIYLQASRAMVLPYGGKACVYVSAGRVNIYKSSSDIPGIAAGVPPSPTNSNTLYGASYFSNPIVGTTERTWASAFYVDEDEVIPIRMPEELKERMLSKTAYATLTSEQYYDTYLETTMWRAWVNPIIPSDELLNVGGLFDGYGWYWGGGGVGYAVSPGIYVGIQNRDSLPELPPRTNYVLPNYPGLGYEYVTPLMPDSSQRAGSLAFATDPDRLSELVLVRDRTIPDELGGYVAPEVGGDGWQSVRPEITMPKPGTTDASWLPFTDWNDTAFCQESLLALGFTEADFTI